MPAAAVIPAPVAYIKVVAVKKLVVGSQRGVGGRPSRSDCLRLSPTAGRACPSLSVRRLRPRLL